MALSGSQVVQHGVSGYTQVPYDGDFSGKTPQPEVSGGNTAASIGVGLGRLGLVNSFLLFFILPLL